MTTTQQPPALDIDAMATSILAVYRTADEGQRMDGMTWYQTAHALAKTLADSAGHDVARAAGVISALSPRTNWDQNQKLAIRCYVERGITGGPGYGLPAVPAAKADAIYNGADVPATLKAPKTVAFAALIADPTDAESVVVDRHALAIAHGRVIDKNDVIVTSLGRKGRYESYAMAYRKAAAEVGITPGQIQAVTWVTWRETEIRVAASIRKAAGR